MSQIKEYIPSIYDGVVEMEALGDSYDVLLNTVEDVITKFSDSQFILSAPLEVIKEWEKLLKIYAKDTDTLELRRERVMNRLSMSPPYSLPYLRQRLDGIIGVGKYQLYMDYDNYTMYVESSANNQFWAEEINITIGKIKPANIVFINKPLITYNSIVNESIELIKLIYNYKLGTTWTLGRKAFVTENSGGVIKMANVRSIQNKFLNDIAEFSANDINNVLLNDTETIDTFSIKKSVDNVVTIEYTVPAELGIVELTNIKLRDAENNVLTSADVYVNIADDIIVKHIINVKEGV